MARHREYTLPLDVKSSIDWLFSVDPDDLTLTGPDDDMWKKFDLITPPDSPPHELDDDCFLTTSLDFSLSDMCGGAALASNLIQDCMWSGTDGEQARTSRIRKVSLSELTMLTTSTACVDPTSISSCPRAQNQLEHSYSLTTPEPLRVPAIMTPDSTDDSESEEDMIDVVTIDTRAHGTSPAFTREKTQSQLQVRDNLQAVANRLTRDSYKRPKCMSDHDFALPIKKVKKFQPHSISPSRLSSQNSSDSEDFEGKRSQHNVMERQRRNDLKNSLLSLRSCLPTINAQERAPKVVVLSHATEYVKKLRKEDSSQIADYRRLKQQNLELKRRLEYVQSKLGIISL